MGVYLGQMMITILVLVEEEVGSPLIIQTQQVYTSTGMMFKDGEQFKSTIRKYSLCCRREIKIIKNEPTRVRVKCIASKKCEWEIFASYSNMFRCMQVKIFHDEHNCCISFRNKMVKMKVIVENFEATSRDHPKMKLRETQRRLALEMNVNVNMTMCRRAKKMVKDKLAEIFVEEFSMLWDYADELRLQNPGNTIKMVVNRGTPKSPPHFKRFYVCFEALKRGWKEGCRLILSLDGCFLKGPFKGEMLFAVGRDGNNQMYLVTWAIIEGECTDS
ncbi:hypothetical protein Gotri_020900 [Gossypium trilobum]|uniref:Transposase MuDR plant domain-containing protein n=1 Tax=Gossypium trilobum TaxID=34281 RepID=A0A7J9DB81_9ROSI|nr:hypothetical protein [Gossypium trilobum]